MKNAKTLTKVTTWGIEVALVIFLFAGCAVKPEEIAYGQDNCAHCQMTIMDNRYAALLLTIKGRSYKFDAIECLLAFRDKSGVKNKDIHSLYVALFAQPGHLRDATSCYYLQSDALRSPMGLNAAAFADRHSAQEAQRKYPGEVFSWYELVKVATSR